MPTSKITRRAALKSGVALAASAALPTRWAIAQAKPVKVGLMLPYSGTFAQLVQAAEKCPVAAIHPGTPINPKEKDIDKWLKRAQAF